MVGFTGVEMNRSHRAPWCGWPLLAAAIWLTFAPATLAAFPLRSEASQSVGPEIEPALHKYLYADADPVQGFDPTGMFRIDESIQTNFVQSITVRTVVPTIRVATYSAAKIATSVGFGAAAGAGVYALVAASQNTAAYEEARERLGIKIDQEQRRRGRRILFYYRDPGRIMFIAATGLLPTTGANGIGFPAGAYATDVTPVDRRFTQRQLSEAFFGARYANYGENPSVSYFVAFFADILWHPLMPRIHPDIAHWHKAAPHPSRVPIEVIAAGPNLMRP